MAKITDKELREIVGLNLTAPFACSNLGLIDSKIPETLSYVAAEQYVEQANANDNINAVFADFQLAPRINKIAIVVDDPAWAFWSVHNSCARDAKEKDRTETVVHPTAKIHRTAFISEHNVSIGAHTVIEPNVTIHSDVCIGSSCVIRSGSVCGFDGFEHKRTKLGILSINHDGRVIINDHVEIGSLNSIAKGFSWRDTIIGRGTKTDSLVHIAHCVTIGADCLITACAEISGSVVIGNNCWLGPNSSVVNGATLGNNVFVGIGTVVTKSFPDGSKIAGNPAKILRSQE